MTSTIFESRILDKGIERENKMKTPYLIRWFFRVTDKERLKKGSVIFLYETLEEHPEKLGVITKNLHTDKIDSEIRIEIMYLTGPKKGIKKMILISDYDVIPQPNGKYKKEKFIIISNIVPTKYIGEIFQIIKLNPAKTAM